VSDTVEIEYHPRGEVVLPAGAQAPAAVYVVRTGEIELFSGGRVVDARGPGELVALPEALAGRPLTHGIRAADDALLARRPAYALVSVLARPAGVRFVARSVQDRDLNAVPADRTAGSLARLVAVCTPQESVADAVGRMAEVGGSGVVVRGADGALGIVTDHDLRRRVLARRRPVHTPLAEIMTADAVTVPPGAPATPPRRPCSCWSMRSSTCRWSPPTAWSSVSWNRSASWRAEAARRSGCAGRSSARPTPPS